ncbi:ArsR/SmtB family transcription factor [Brachybacterium saurashtrense]|uniref:ArsR family transcriptional regulator n=1 Tax=Brachybacterium saurashtrense TaxID=556288 RepID=A0A345YR55_9MICO|nr:winged helix-turn-helix domain-containing protein [Brachybacterium saurashtrense]AXK46407.1 ArsR family transcriptional regulator [Brachybacterium saurashtrense]RRR24148.1 ArsR family transcriptional regulator [Brachybacterium saurashtrense]
MQRIDEDRADAWFQALSDRTRRDILRRVLVEEQSVSSLARNYSMSLTAVQKHVAVLERSGLLTRRRRGRETLARGAAGTLRTASELLTAMERGRREHIARIDELLEAEHDAAPETPRGTEPEAERGTGPLPSP